VVVMNDILWLAKHAGEAFALPRGRTKGQDANGRPTFETGWQTNPHSTQEAIAHAEAGNNVGYLTGRHCGIIAIDIDRDYPAVVESLGPYAKTIKIKRATAPDRGKLAFRVTFPVTTQSWTPEGWEPPHGEKRSPWAELLSDGRHALFSGEYEGGQYFLDDKELGIAELSDDDLALVWYKVTIGRSGLPEPAPIKQTRPRTATEKTQDASKDLILDAWSTFDVFDYHGRATEVKEEKSGEVRLMGNGGLLIKPNGEGWYCHADNKGGGDSISAWAFCTRRSPIVLGRAYWDVMREMAEAKGLQLPDTREKTTATNGSNGTHSSFDNYQNNGHANLHDQTANLPLDSNGTAGTSPDTLDADKVLPLIELFKDYRGEAKRAAMDVLKGLITKLPAEQRIGLPQALVPLFDDYKRHERIERFLSDCALPAAGPRFQPYSFADLINRPPKPWHVNQIFGPGDIGEIFGPPGSAKTFGVIDLVFSCCLGNMFARRFEVIRQLNVAYCAGEGLGGLPARFAAAAQHYGVDRLPGFTFFEAVPQLYDQDSADSIVRFIAEWKERQERGTAEPLDLLIIDTQHSATVGADENSAQDMGKVLGLAKLAIRELGCAVLLVHHTNKAGTGERGSSAMRGAMDFMLEFKPVAGKYAMSCEKLKDAAAWKPQTFDLVELGDSARVWWDELQVSDQVVNKQDRDVDAILAVLKSSKGTRYQATHLAEAIGMGGSKQIFTLLPKAMRADAHLRSGLKDPNKDASSRNPLVYWYGNDDGQST
jgi:hypothetical protein